MMQKELVSSDGDYRFNFQKMKGHKIEMNIYSKERIQQASGRFLEVDPIRGVVCVLDEGIDIDFAGDTIVRYPLEIVSVGSDGILDLDLTGTKKRELIHLASIPQREVQRYTELIERADEAA